MLATFASASTPISAESENKQESVAISHFEETAEKLVFVVDGGSNVRIHLNPERFALQEGSEYSVNTSLYPPFIIKPDRNGEITLSFEYPENCTVLVEPSKGGNLLPAFEDGPTDVKPKGWEFEIAPVRRSLLGYGHEGIPPGGVSFGGSDNPKLSGLSWSERGRRPGSRSIQFKKGVGENTVKMKLSETVRVQPGQVYLLEGYYQLDTPSLGSSIVFMAVITSEGKPPIYIRDFFLNPPVYTGLSWRRAFQRFEVPKDYADAMITVEVAAQGTPYTAYWTDLSLRIAPTAVIQYPSVLSAELNKIQMSSGEVLQLMKERKPFEVKLARDKDQPILLVDGKPQPLFGFVSCPGDLKSVSSHGPFAQADVHLHWLPVYTAQTGVSQQYGRPLWLADGEYDFSSLEEKIADLLSRDPDARIMLYLGIFTYRDFGAKHPEAIWRNMNNKKTVGSVQALEMEELPPEVSGLNDETWNISYTASAFREETSRMLEALGNHLAKSDLGKAVIGVHLACGNDGQWFCPVIDHLERSEGSRKAFGEWLSRQYRDVDALRTAWADKNVTFQTVTFPEEIERSPDKFYLDSQKGQDRKLIDSSKFSNEGIAETINLFARSFKAGIGRPTFVSTYYHDVLHNHGVNHFALKTLIESPDLDGIASVIDYGLWRTVGKTGNFNSLAASLRLHNKIFFSELDYRTNYSWLPADALNFRTSWGVSNNAEEWTNQLRRDLGMSLAQGQGAWIYGLGGNGWITDAYFRGIKEAADVAARVASHPKPGDRGQIAVFCDEDVQSYTTRKDAFGANLTMVSHNLIRSALTRSGASWDAYLLTDLDNPQRPDYKVNILLTSLKITPSQIKAIRSRMQKDGRTVVFINALGQLDGDAFADFSRDLTGITIKKDLSRTEVGRLKPDPAGGEMSENIGDVVSEMFGPSYWVDDKDAKPLARRISDGRVVIAMKAMEDWTSVYLGMPGGFSPRFIRNLVKNANLVPVGPEGDATFSGNGIITIHALSPGEKTIHWTGKCDLLDLTKGTIVARDTESFSFTMDAFTTRWFQRL